jgi:molybdenum cofactor cytidylyltransferase
MDEMKNEGGKNVFCIILAAGGSGRMGRQKALLTVHGKSFLRYLVDAFQASNAAKTVVVVGDERRVLEEHLSGSEALIALNDRFMEGQLSSIIKGLRTIETFHPDAVLVHPVDHPLISSMLVNSIIDAFADSSAPIVLPVFNGRRGHPVLFSASLFDELMAAPPNVGARSVVWAHARDVREVETNEEGVVLDVDTPEEYARLQRITGDAL